jgi:hypothetical protein
MRSEGRTSAQFLEVTQPVAKHDNVIRLDNQAPRLRGAAAQSPPGVYSPLSTNDDRCCFELACNKEPRSRPK